MYGFQWRHFGAEYVDMHADYKGKGIDQLAEVLARFRQISFSNIEHLEKYMSSSFSGSPLTTLSPA